MGNLWLIWDFNVDNLSVQQHYTLHLVVLFMWVYYKSGWIQEAILEQVTPTAP